MLYIINFIWDFISPIRGIYSVAPAANLSKAFIEIIFILFIIIIGYNIGRVINSKTRISQATHDLASFNNFDTTIEQFNQYTSGKYQIFANYLSEYNGRLYLFQDCETVLAEVWYPPILKSYFLPSGAALLTGIGVLGTFLGLLIGIQDLRLDDLTSIHKGINNIATGASTAFETSVWGVALSLLLTFLEKTSSAYIKDLYVQYEKKVSANFPPLPLGTVFIDIRKETGESLNTLNGLAEQISNNMQTSLDSFSQNLLDHLTNTINNATSTISDTISASLVDVFNATISPSIDSIANAAKDLAERQAKGSEEALGNLMQRFSGKLTEEGNSQRLAMEATTQKMEESFTTFVGNMERLINSIISNTQDMALTHDYQLKELQTAFIERDQQNNKNMENAKASIIELINNFSSSVQEKLESQVTNLDRVSHGIEDSMEIFTYKLNDFLDSITKQQQIHASTQEVKAKEFESGERQIFNEYFEMLKISSTQTKEQLIAVQTLIDQGRQLQEKISEDQKHILEIARAMSASGDAMDKASSNLDAFANRIKQSIEHNAQCVEKSANLLDDIGNKQKLAIHTLQDLGNKLTHLYEGMDQASSNLVSSINISKQNFNELAHRYQELQQNLTANLEQIRLGAIKQTDLLAEHMEALLKSFGERLGGAVNERMNAWNEQTRSFCQNMTDVTEAMSDIIETLDSDHR